jgi:hypothetical protein
MKNIIVSLLLSLGAISGCAATGVQSPSLEDVNDFERINSCVRGGLPMEVIFSVPDNPRRLTGGYVTLEDIDSFVSKMDGKLRLLLKSSIQKAFRKAGLKREKPLMVDQHFSLLSSELSRLIAEDGPRAFGVEFCGAVDSVGNAVSADVSGYFERALLANDGSYASWATRVAGEGHELSLLLVMAALRSDDLSFESSAMTLSSVGER